MKPPDLNPYQPPSASPVSGADSRVEQDRAIHLKTESSLKIGIPAVLILTALIVGFLSFGLSRSGISVLPLGSVIVFLLPIMSLGMIAAAVGSAMLAPWSRWMITAVSAAMLLISLLSINLIGIGVFTYFLVLVNGRKASRVLRSDYRAVIAATPHMRYKTPKGPVIALVVLLLVLAAIIWWGIASR
ncbi:MAG: hypothetical protein R3F11_28030 [Verrucomicrobiales bacterium]